MKPLICPQCGGKNIEYKQLQPFVTCEYCDTRFIAEQAEKPEPMPNFEPLPENSSEILQKGQNLVIGIVAAVTIVFGGIIFLSLVKSKPRQTVPNYPVYKTTTTPPAPQRS